MTTDDILTYISVHGREVEDMKKIRLAADKAIKANRQAPLPVQHYSSWSMEVAGGLWALVHDRYQFLKEPKLEQWAEDIEKLHRLDNYSTELVEAVAKWSQQDPFWRQQVRSGANLRKHFDKMLVRIKEERSRQGAVTI